ncbi:MAG: UDP-glucose/GDP-mannose dehydrogenase family protein [Lachnospiraceae bacterium]|nr:UDP-glucose/GDP-mannose dehydrogenase family protein [Lachnospiraceae bacterium]
MKIAVVGTGYVGLVTGACLSDLGNEVWCVDVEKEKIEKLKQGILPIYEPGLEEMVKSNYHVGHLKFTTEICNALEAINICFIAVGTPMGEDGSADLQYVLKVAESIGQGMKHHMYVVDKSTVPVGTAKKVREKIQEELEKRGSDLTFDVISNPEFLKEGTAVSDCSRPDRIVIGTDNDQAAKVMRELYLPLVRNNENFIFMDIASAEMTKYAANAMLATKISFMNEISNICEKVGADVNKVRLGIGSDKRIGFSFIYAGCGYGGSCFPKDVQALIKTSYFYHYEPKILKAVEQVNAEQKQIIPRKIVERFGEELSGYIFAVWGLSFKPDTDDMREAASVTIINELTKRGAKIKAYDPKAEEEAKNYYLKENKNVTYYDSKYTVLNEANAMILITEWKEFRAPDFEEMKKRLKQTIIFDGRNQYSTFDLEQNGFEYYQIGVGK